MPWPTDAVRHLLKKEKLPFIPYDIGKATMEYHTTVIVKKLELPNLKKEWEDIFKLMDKKELKISDKKEIQKEIAETADLAFA